MDGAAATGVAWRDEVREAVARLPERQREALALRDGALSYAEIGTRLELDAGAVAQLIERARINLYDELRGTALASIAAPSVECERALPLIAARQDAELDAPEDVVWLDAHLAGCERCRLADEQMGEAAAFYRGEEPAAASPAGAQPRSSEAPAVAPLPASSRKAVRSRPVTTGLVAGVAALLLLGGVGVAALTGAGGGNSGDPAAASAASRQSHMLSPHAARRARAARHPKRRRDQSKKSQTAAATATSPAAGETTPTPTPTVTRTRAPLTTGGEGSGGSASGPDGSSGKAAVQPTKTTASQPTPKPEPAAPESTPSSQPPPEPAPPATTTEAESQPPAEEAERPGHSGEPPGKATGNPHGAPPGQQ